MEEILHTYRSGWHVALSIVVIGVVVIGITVLADSTRIRSSEGVETVNDYEALISKGDVLVLSSSSGKTTNYWKVTYDGNKTVTIQQDASLFPNSYSGTLCGVDCRMELEMGWLRHITVTEKANHRVSVQWPWGWGYRRYHT
jgi:hypothetical protein